MDGMRIRIDGNIESPGYCGDKSDFTCFNTVITKQNVDNLKHFLKCGSMLSCVLAL